jgi:small subunit ribosomal protein S4
MKIGPRYKIARRLGASIFEKTQTQGFARSLARREKAGTTPTRPKSEYGKQLLEKQKARFTYALSEKQFSGYVKSAAGHADAVDRLYRTLESRLDNVLYRAGLAKTRLQARQIASHGHATVNGRRVTIPSIILRKDDIVSVREGSAKSALFEGATERMKTQSAPAWLVVDAERQEAKVVGVPAYTPAESSFDINTILEYYSR